MEGEREKIELGETYRDDVTQFEGLATGYAEFLHDSDQVQLENDASHRWFAVGRVTKV